MDVSLSGLKRPYYFNTNTTTSERAIKWPSESLHKTQKRKTKEKSCKWCHALSLHLTDNQLCHSVSHAVNKEGHPLGKMTAIFMIISFQFVHTFLSRRHGEKMIVRGVSSCSTLSLTSWMKCSLKCLKGLRERFSLCFEIVLVVLWCHAPITLREANASQTSLVCLCLALQR